MTNRHTIRLQGYDYSSEGLYFVTICCQDRTCLLSSIVGVGFYPTRNNKPFHHPMIDLSVMGQIVYQEWTGLPGRFPHVIFHEFVIMPNHMHGIIEIGQRAGQSPAPTLGNIIGAFKSITTKKCNVLNDTPGQRLWQRNYYEHIIRNGESYENISNYIYENPVNWMNDDYYTE